MTYVINIYCMGKSCRIRRLCAEKGDEIMPRPCKRRRICAMPECWKFGPSREDADRAGEKPVIMALDEFETIRLIDLEGMTQEECASQMDIARTTAQAIYSSARAKMAECLVNGRQLHIEGGEYDVCDGSSEGRGCGCPSGCRRGRGGMNCSRHSGEASADAEPHRGDCMRRVDEIKNRTAETE